MVFPGTLEKNIKELLNNAKVLGFFFPPGMTLSCSETTEKKIFFCWQHLPPKDGCARMLNN